MNIIKYFIVFLFGPEFLLAIEISTSYTVHIVNFRYHILCIKVLLCGLQMAILIKYLQILSSGLRC